MSPPVPPISLRLVWLLLAAILLLTGVLGFLTSRPVPLPEVNNATLPCVSYAPFRRMGHTPFDPDLRVTPAEIAADLRLLTTVTSCVRTYGLDHGLDAVPDIARQLGLRVMLGVWIGRDPVANQRQLQQALALTHTHREVIDLLMVGNEVLLRGDLAPEELVQLLDAARSASAVPVSYADVWAFWERHASALTAHVDVVSVHILPYWEDAPVGIDAAIDTVYRTAAAMQARFAGKPVFVAETGWPAAGRQRGPAAPGRLEQARFVRELLARHAVEPLRFNFIEGFDQPWKRRLEGEMGGAWGLFDAHGERRVPLTGPGHPEPLFGALRWLSVPLLPLWREGWFEWAAGIGLLSLALLCAVAAARRMRVLGSQSPWRKDRMLNTTLVLLLALLAIDALWLIVDGRYRPLRWELAAIPLPFLLGLAWLGERLPARRWAQRPLAAGTAVVALLVSGHEGLANMQALRYGGLLALLALVSFYVYRPHRAAVSNAPSSSAGKSCSPPNPPIG
jgi:exo-beta-1,3-glucanase (GH17 family)